MQIDKEKLLKNLSKLEQEKLDELLDYRDDDGFDKEWLDLYEKCNISTKIESKELFLDLNKLTNGHEICSYISDDLELIQKARALGIDSQFLEYLEDSYKKGIFPFKYKEDKFNLAKEILETINLNLTEYKLNTDLLEEIPDTSLLITEVFPKDELEEIYKSFSPYLEDNKILPFASTLGDSNFCIGFSKENFGKIYYQDLDFGVFKVADSMESFIKALRKKDTKDYFCQGE